MILYAKIFFEMKQEHPDRKYVKDPEKELCFMNIYYDNHNYYDDRQQFEDHAKNDLWLVANGGYNNENYLKNIRYEIFSPYDLEAIKYNKVKTFKKELEQRKKSGFIAIRQSMIL